MFGSDSESENDVQCREDACGVMQFHSGTEISMFLFVEQHLKKVQPRPSGDELVDSIISAIDKFCLTRHWMMHIGPGKSEYLKNAAREISREKGQVLRFLELGSYCGYSSVLLARELRRQDTVMGTIGSKLICVEADGEAVGYTRRMLALAELSDYAEVLHTKVDEGGFLKVLEAALQPARCIDLLFIDHDKARYLQDLRLLQSFRLPVAQDKQLIASAPPHSSQPVPRRPKILCLHGFEQTAAILRMRLGGLPRKLKHVTFHFLDGPVQLPLRGEQTEPLRSWWTRRAEGLIDDHSLEEALHLVEESWRLDGPFDGILGFSMGAVFACQIAMRLPCVGLKFIICAGAPYHPSITSDALHHLSHLPNLHIYGTADTTVDPARSILLMEQWRDTAGRTEAPVVIEHDKGHCIPTQASYLNQYRDFINDALGRQPEEQEKTSSTAELLPILRPGCVVVADNVLSFGVPLEEYLQYVRSSSSSSLLFKDWVEYSRSNEGATESALHLDGVEVSVLE